MNRNLVYAAALGSAVMFVLDPSRGRRRRAVMRDKVTRATRRTRDGLDATARDIANRASGIVAATRGRVASGAVSDRTLRERVRAKLGRVSSHPHAIDVHVDDGDVTLHGTVLRSEVDDILLTVARVRGVTGVTNELRVYDTARGVPSLQGAGRVAGPSLDILQSRWAPATRAMVGVGLLATGVWMAIARASRAA